MEDKLKNNEKEIFTPNELNDYINIVKPSTWLVTFAMIIIFIGFFVWSVFGYINDTVDSITFVKEFDCKTFVHATDVSRVNEGMVLQINNKEYLISSVENKMEEINDIIDDKNINTGSFNFTDNIYEVKVDGISDAGLTNGIYKGKIVTNKISPISFFVN